MTVDPLPLPLNDASGTITAPPASVAPSGSNSVPIRNNQHPSRALTSAIIIDSIDGTPLGEEKPALLPGLPRKEQKAGGGRKAAVTQVKRSQCGMDAPLLEMKASLL